MTRHRLGVVLLIPEPAATEVRGLRRAVGCPSLETQPPHLTLVPPVNVRDDAIDDAIEVLRRAAAMVRRPVSITLGPVTSFAPVSPTLHLGVGGDLDTVRLLQGAVFTPPLFRRVDYDFVPHVTLHESADDELVRNGPNVLGSFLVAVRIDRIDLLVQREDRHWSSLTDVPLGPVTVRGRGGVELHLRWVERPAPDVGRLWAEASGDSWPDAACATDGRWLEAREADGTLIGARVGEDVAVASHRLGEGIEERLLAEPESGSVSS